MVVVQWYNSDMRSRLLILVLIIMTVLVTVLTASAKLRATPKLDTLQVGARQSDVDSVLGASQITLNRGGLKVWDLDEGHAVVYFGAEEDSSEAAGFPPEGAVLVVTRSHVSRRGPIGRVLWHLGYQNYYW